MAATALIGDLPAVTPIGRVSPTLGESLRACALQVAFRVDDRFKPYRRAGTAAALGIASHELLEEVGEGAFIGLEDDKLRSALERRWDELVASRAEELRAAWPLGEVPEPQRWPGYELTHTRLIRSLVQQHERAPVAAREPQAGSVESEQWLEDEAGVIGGRIDRIEHGSAGVRIVDLKSGWTVGREVTDAQRRQLLIYAYLWHENYGSWPVEAAIQHPDGTRLSVSVAGKDAAREAESLRKSREMYNERACSGVTHDQLAAPSSETCSRCSFKASCPSFFSAAQPEWEWYRPAILIEPAAIEEHSESTLVRGKALATTSSRTPQRGADALVVSVARFSADPQRLLAVAEAAHPTRSGSVRIAWDSTLATWEARVRRALTH